MSDESTTGTTEAAPAASFAELGTQALEAFESATDDGQAAEAPAAEAAADDSASTTEGEAAAEGDDEPQTTDEVLDALANLDREAVPDDLKPLYDQIIAARKSMQADYTRKTMKVAEERKTVEQERAEMQAIIDQRVQEALSQSPQQQAPQAQSVPADLEAAIWEGLGNPIGIEDALNAESPATLEKYVKQQAVVEARKVMLEAMQTAIGPQLMAMQQFVSTSQMSAADAAIETFVSANPDLEPHLGTVISLVEAGVAPDLASAADKARLLVFGEQRIAQAAQLGVEAGKSAAKQVQDNKQQFTTPSAATAPKGTAPLTEAKSFNDLAAVALREFDGG